MIWPLWISVAFTLLLQACATPEALREGSRPLSSAEIEKLYAGRTWSWNAGGAFFAPDHEFRAWSKNKAGRPGYALGEWRATDSGLLCFKGPWHFGGERTFAETCFRHRLADGEIYQRAQPAGSWYLFRSDPPHQDDAWQALVQGDRVSPYLNFIRIFCRSPVERCRLPENSRAFENPLSASELAELYSGRTWQWANGAGYFGAGGWYRGFATDQAGRLGYSIGSWTVDDAGLLCLEGPWTFANATFRSRRCFAHRRDGGTIYQRAEPAGDWYVFKSRDSGAIGEYDKFVAGDAVAPSVREIRGR